MSTQDAVKAAAATWLIDLESAESVDEIWPAFQAWLRQDPEHKKAYLRVEHAWHALDGLLSASTTGRTHGVELVWSIRRN